MNEASDDARAPAEDNLALSAGEGMHDDDVEVVAQAPEQPEPAPAARHDSVPPTARKLAPPPKPKRDSGSPASMPPPAAETLGSVGSLRPPAPPAISYQQASEESKESTAHALGSDPLHVIGEALANDAGAFSTNETPTGGRPPVPRPGPTPVPNELADGAPLPPVEARSKVDDAPAPKPSAPPKSGAVFAQRIISVGTPSSPPPPTASSPPPAVAPPVVEPSPPSTSASFTPPLSLDLGGPSEGALAEGAPEITITTEFEDEAPTSPNASEAPLRPPAPADSPLDVPLVVAAPIAEASLPVAPEPLEAQPPVHVAEPIRVPPDEPRPSEAVLEGAAAARAEEPVPAPSSHSAEEPPTDSGGHQVVELSREDSPSIPPDAPEAPTPATPSVSPAARADVKPPPPPRRAPAPAALDQPAETEKRKKHKRAWWEELFSEDFVRANWKLTDEQVKREVTFVEQSLGVAPGGVVLDLGCGSGQHAVELASRGYGVVGYDLSLYQLALAADIAQERSQKINFLQGDMREMAFEEMFDGIYSWNTSFGYFEEDKNFSVAERAFRALRPGGMFLIDVINRDFVAAHTPSSVWFEGDACVCMDDAVIDYFTSRLRVKRSVILDDGRTRECTYSIRLYSFHELGKLLHEVGFRVTEVSGHPATPGVFLGQASPRILMLAQRP